MTNIRLTFTLGLTVVGSLAYGAFCYWLVMT